MPLSKTTLPSVLPSRSVRAHTARIPGLMNSEGILGMCRIMIMTVMLIVVTELRALSVIISA